MTIPKYEIRDGLVLGLGPDQLAQRRDELLTEARSLTDYAPDGVLTGDSLTRFDTITEEVDAVIATLKRHETLRAMVDSGNAHFDKPWTAANVTMRTSGKPWEVRDYS